MLGHCQTVVYLSHIVGQNDRGGIFLSVQRPLLQCCICFAPGHGSGVCTHFLPECNMNLVFHGTHLQACHISHGVYIRLAVTQIPETGFPDSQPVELHA